MERSINAGEAHPAKTIGLWTKPGMSSGCELDACPDGTVQAGRVAVGQTITVSCVVADGQMLRNSSSDEPGYYEDQKWVRLEPGQQVGKSGDDDLYISNVWFLRDAPPPLPGLLTVHPRGSAAGRASGSLALFVSWTHDRETRATTWPVSARPSPTPGPGR
jgi:hypothetical protein